MIAPLPLRERGGGEGCRGEQSKARSLAKTTSTQRGDGTPHPPPLSLKGRGAITIATGQSPRTLFPDPLLRDADASIVHWSVLRLERLRRRRFARGNDGR